MLITLRTNTGILSSSSSSSLFISGNAHSLNKTLHYTTHYTAQKEHTLHITEISYQVHKSVARQSYRPTTWKAPISIMTYRIKSR